MRVPATEAKIEPTDGSTVVVNDDDLGWYTTSVHRMVQKMLYTHLLVMRPKHDVVSRTNMVWVTLKAVDAMNAAILLRSLP